MADIAQLGLAIDSTSADKGAASLDRLSAAAQKAEVAVARAADMQARAAIAAAKASATATKAEMEALAAAQRVTSANLAAARAMQAKIAADRAQAAASNNTADAYTRQAAAAMAAANAASAQAFYNQVLGLDGVAKSARESAAAFDSLFAKQDAIARAAMEASQSFYNEVLGINRVTKSARDSASAFDALFVKQDAAARAAMEASQAFYNEVLGVTRVSKSARESAAAFDLLIQKQDALAATTMEASQAFYNQTLGIDRAAKSARDSAAVFASQAEFGAEQLNRMGGSFSGLSAQFQDIGVTAAMGMSPVMVAFQQGTQIAGQLEYMASRGANAWQVFGNALKSILSPMSLMSIGMTALAVVLIQAVDWIEVARTALYGLADGLEIIAPYAAGAAAALALLYAPSILSGIASLATSLLGAARAAGVAALAFVAANPAVAFVLGVTAAIAAANMFRDQLAQIFGRDIVEDAKNAANWVVGAFVGAYRAIVATWDMLPAAIGDVAITAVNAYIGAVENMLNTIMGLVNLYVDRIEGVINTVSGWIGRDGVQIGRLGEANLGRMANPFQGAASDAASVASDAFSTGFGADYIGEGMRMIGDAASWAADKMRGLAASLGEVDDKGKKQKDRYKEIVQGAQQFIAMQELEARTIGMTELEANKLIYAQELLNEATRAGLELTPEQVITLRTLGAQMAEAEAATKRLADAYKWTQDTFRGFFDDVRRGLQEGASAWEIFGNAVANVLDRIADRLMDMAADGLLDALLSATGGNSSGGLLGTIGGFLGFADGGAFDRTNVVPFAKGGAFTNSIVDRPTLFSFANGGALGEMGEAGPEAIMPLYRGPDGSLGVRASNNNDRGPTVVYNIDARGADKAQIQRLERVIVEMNRTFDQRAVGAVLGQKSRMGTTGNAI